MAIFTSILDQVIALSDLIGEGATAESLVEDLSRLTNDQLIETIQRSGNTVRSIERVGIVAAGLVAARSTRETGHNGLVQKKGYPNAVSLIQDLTGVTGTDARKQVLLGTSMLERDAPVVALPPGGEGNAGEAPVESGPSWNTILKTALMDEAISSAQHEAMLRGLGAPPEGADEAWSLAVSQLFEEAPERKPEELRRTARIIRDRLDPEGAAARGKARFEQRSFRMYTDADGIHHAQIKFDDEGALWMRAIIDTALRPRRGGPRFVDSDERAKAEELSNDPRTNDQLTYDLVIDVLIAGSRTDAETVFGTRQAGVRIVQVIDADGTPAGLGYSETDGTTLPTWLVAQKQCDLGTILSLIDRNGNPLYLGRQQRLFSGAQKIALVLRDGGCRWRGCDRPPEYCEAHHIDHYQDGGNTDVDRGILLCRFHHLELHNGRWHITRKGLDDFKLHHPSGKTIVLKPRLALSYAWGGIDPPPKRFHAAA